LQTAEELARAEASAQAVDTQLREVGRYLLLRTNANLRVLDGVFEATHNESRDDDIEDDRDEPPQNSGMYS